MPVFHTGAGVSSGPHALSPGTSPTLWSERPMRPHSMLSPIVSGLSEGRHLTCPPCIPKSEAVWPSEQTPKVSALNHLCCRESLNDKSYLGCVTPEGLVPGGGEEYNAAPIPAPWPCRNHASVWLLWTGPPSLCGGH